MAVITKLVKGYDPDYPFKQQGRWAGDYFDVKGELGQQNDWYRSWTTFREFAWQAVASYFMGAEAEVGHYVVPIAPYVGPSVVGSVRVHR